MAGSGFGALGATFNMCRILQAASLIGVIGMTANFAAEIISVNASVPSVIVGTLSVVCIAVLYCAITFILFLDGTLPFLITTAMDSLLLIALIVVAVTVGKPLSYLDCEAIGKVSGVASSAYAFTAALGNSLDQSAGKIDYGNFIGGTKSTCLEMKSIWGLSIALCILFAFSAICSTCLWRRSKQEGAKDVEK